MATAPSEFYDIFDNQIIKIVLFLIAIGVTIHILRFKTLHSC